jgi:hypothetical protein
MERYARDKHSSLFGIFVNDDDDKKVYLQLIIGAHVIKIFSFTNDAQIE